MQGRLGEPGLDSTLGTGSVFTVRLHTLTCDVTDRVKAQENCVNHFSGSLSTDLIICKCVDVNGIKQAVNLWMETSPPLWSRLKLLNICWMGCHEAGDLISIKKHRD